MKKVLLILMATSLLQGCAYADRMMGKEGNGWAPWRAAPEYSRHTMVEDQEITEDYFKSRLLETAEMVSKSLRDLAEIEQAVRMKRHMEIAQASENIKDPRLLQMVTISSLRGTELNIESILERLSNVAEYEFKVFGKRPLVPITVSVPKGQYRLVDLLKNIGMQAGGNGTVFIKDGVIELVYTSDI